MNSKKMQMTEEMLGISKCHVPRFCTECEVNFHRKLEEKQRCMRNADLKI